MHITFILPFASLAGGIRVIATYARVLSEMGHEVTVISQPKRLRGTRTQQVFRALSNRLRGVRPKRPTPLLDVLGTRHIVLEKARPVTAEDVPQGDVVIATWWETAQAVADLPASCGRKFYLIQDYEIFENLPKDAVAATYALPLHKIAVSGYIRDCLANFHGVRDVTVIPNAVDTVQFHAPERAKNTRPTVGFLYHAHPRKQTELAIAAVTQARAALPDLRVIAFGRASPAEQFQFPDWIEYNLSPHQLDIPGIYAACDAWLFTSRTEGFGLPLLEAMACRTPVLATRAGAAEDLIDGQNGRILDADPKAFAAAITEFMAQQDAAWRVCSDSAYQTAREYSWENAAEKLIETVRAPAA